MRPSRLSATLLGNYRTARYEVAFRGLTLRLTVGEPLPPRLRAWLGEARGAALVTPAAPFGRSRLPGAERAVFRRFIAQLRRTGRRHLRGEGRSGTDASWPAEASALVALACRADAVVLGSTFRQNAVLWARRSGPVLLLPLR
ncbi:DUF3293 domain-containing protein [Elioraea sp.]|uniref:DUF3293 domain-containing protein n=1 Tax=Elioraea sp. TaxID=2185103 RepID=UPI0025B808A2|nr:DUF3293 domain-containing protein [Elioraea sp.]